MNNSRSFEDDVDEGPRERLLVGDGARQRLQGRPFGGASLLLLARPSARSRPSVKYTDTDGRLFYTPVKNLDSRYNLVYTLHDTALRSRVSARYVV